MNGQQAQQIEKTAGANEVMEIGFKRLSENAVLPTKNHSDDSGFDVYAAEDIIIKPGATAVVKTEIAVVLPPYHEAYIRNRSGVASKTKLRIVSPPIDEGYRGPVGIIIDNTHVPEHGYGLNDVSNNVIKPATYTNAVAYQIRKGDRIAQLTIQPRPNVVAVEITELGESARGEAGFGSSGV